MFRYQMQITIVIVAMQKKKKKKKKKKKNKPKVQSTVNICSKIIFQYFTPDKIFPHHLPWQGKYMIIYLL